MYASTCSLLVGRLAVAVVRAAMDSHQKQCKRIVLFIVAEVSFLPINRRHAKLFEVHVHLLQHRGRGARSFIFVCFVLFENRVQLRGESAQRAQRKRVDRLSDAERDELRDDQIPHLLGVTVERNDLLRLAAGDAPCAMPIGSESSVEIMLLLRFPWAPTSSHLLAPLRHTPPLNFCQKMCLTGGTVLSCDVG